MNIKETIKWAFSPFKPTETVVEVAVEKTVDTVISAFAIAVADLKEVAAKASDDKKRVEASIKSMEQRVADLAKEAERATNISDKLSAILG